MEQPIVKNDAAPAAAGPGVKERYPLVDAVRGAAVLSMVAFHFSYDVFMVFGVDTAWYARPLPHLWQQSICFTFILVSGFVWSWGRRTNLRRGLMLNLLGLILTAVTVLALPSEAIWFGVLNFLGCAVLLLIPLDGVLRRVPPHVGMLASALLFLVFRRVQYGVVGLPGLFTLAVPGILYRVKWLTPLGFPFAGFYSSDYFPVLPWFFLYLCGYYGKSLYFRHPALRRLAWQDIPFLSWIGRNAIWIYLAHQPVCMLVCLLIFH